MQRISFTFAGVVIIAITGSFSVRSRIASEESGRVNRHRVITASAGEVKPYGPEARSDVDSAPHSDQDGLEKLQRLTKAAEAGDAHAMNSIGEMYFTGEGVTMDRQVAIQWFTNAARAGYTDGLTRHGFVYHNGKGSTPNNNHTPAPSRTEHHKGLKGKVVQPLIYALSGVGGRSLFRRGFSGNRSHFRLPGRRRGLLLPSEAQSQSSLLDAMRESIPMADQPGPHGGSRRDSLSPVDVQSPHDAHPKMRAAMPTARQHGMRGRRDRETGRSRGSLTNSGDSAAGQFLRIGDPARPLGGMVHWIKGQPVNEYKKGHVYVLYFWASWCGPCIQSIPTLNKLSIDYKDRSVSVIGLAIWSRGDVKSTADFVRKHGAAMSYDIAEDVDGKVSDAYMAAAQLIGIPTTMIVDSDGRLAWMGPPMNVSEALETILVENSSSRVDAARRHEIVKEGGRPISTIPRMEPRGHRRAEHQNQLYLGRRAGGLR